MSSSLWYYPHTCIDIYIYILALPLFQGIPQPNIISPLSDQDKYKYDNLFIQADQNADGFVDGNPSQYIRYKYIYIYVSISRSISLTCPQPFVSTLLTYIVYSLLLI